MTIYYVNGSYKNKANALISVEDRGFNFSDGVYEVIGFNQQKFKRLLSDSTVNRYPRLLGAARL